MEDKSKTEPKGTQANQSPAGSSQPASLEATDLPPEANLSAQNDTTASEPPGGNDQPGGKKSPIFKRILGRHNIYLLVLALLILATVAAIFVAVKQGKSSNKNAKTPSLTSAQLSELKGSTTLVGDPQQILDVQSNSVFEGQVLVRNNLDVAGSIKVGGPLSLSSVSVGGTSRFGKVAIGNDLAVAGTTSLQGPVNLQSSLAVSGSATFGGTISAGKLNVGSLRLSGDLIISRHITLGGGVPSRTGGSALGSGGTASVNGSDVAGTVTINTGGGPPVGCFVTISFTRSYNSTPHVVISPSNSRAGSINYYTNRSTGSFSICTTSSPVASSTYLFDYIVID